MSVLHRGKSTILQTFPAEDVVRWKKRLSTVPPEVVELLSGVLGAATLHIQLETLRKLGKCVQMLPSDVDGLRDVICVLVEMHAACMSRHSVQRTLASILQGLPHASVEAYVMATVSKALCSQWLTDHMKRIQYIDAVVENFKTGEAAVQRVIPLVLEYCISTLNCHCCQIKRQDVSVLTAVLKTTANLLQKFSTEVCQMQSVQEPDRKADDSLLLWPQHVSGRSTHEKVQWMKEQLTSVKKSCEDILMKADDVPHDCAISAAMLAVVLLLKESMDADVDEKISHFYQQWLTEDSPLQPFGSLTVVYALLAKVPALNLVVVMFCGKPLLMALFPTICQLFNSFTETSDRYIASCTLALWISVARDCIKDISPISQLYKSLLPTGEIMQTLLQYVWSLWEDPVDGIRNQCKEIFKSIIETYQQLQSGGTEDYLFSMVEILLALKTPTRGKFLLLSSLSQYVTVEQIIQADPGLPEEIMAVMGHQALACHAGELWSRLTTLHWKMCVNKDLWYKTWVDVAIKRMCEGSPLARQHITQHCLPALFHCTNECMEYVNQQLQSERMSSVSAECKLVTQLACLRCAKTECKQFDTSASFSSSFITAMHCSDVQIRLSALGLVCESHRTTEPLDPSCLHLVLQFMELNANSQSPGFRYPAVNSLKKLLIRIRDSSYTLMKQHQKGRCEAPKKYISSLQEFLQQLLTQQFEVLHPLSSFQRRNLALMILQLMAIIFESHPTDTTIPPIFNFCTALSDSQAMSLLHGLRDSYDANRILYLDLLREIPAERLGLMDQVFLEHLVAMFFGLVASPKAVNCASAASMLKLFLHKVCSNFNIQLQAITKKVYGESIDADFLKVMPGSSYVHKEYPQWSTIHLLSGILHQHIQAAERDLVQASMLAPIHGVIQCIRVAFAEASTISPISKVLDQYKSAISVTVTLCVRVAKIVSPVVCNSSPEGFLPETQSLDKFGVSELLEEAIPTTGNAQSLLLCCWHSMKEISLLFGYLAEHAPVEVDQTESGVLTLEQLGVFANIFINQLTEARHRGAFEMAYTGFTKLCHCLWTSSCSELHQKPSFWVQELLESLQSTSLSRLLTITRRSAGLPFYLQSILTAEPSYTGRSCLKSTMKTLLKIAGSCKLPEAPTSGNLQMTHPEVQPLPGVVHALNILRALYRDARLGDYIIPFVAEGVMLAIEGFSSAFWPVRNSSTLLFSALVARIFGAKRASDEHSMENKLTAKEFFTRFPSLHGFLLEELITASQMLEKRSGKVLHSSLFPLLLLLSRLYPSALDEENSVTSLKPFLPLLLKCPSCPEWKTRVLISHAVVSTVSAHDLPSVIKDIVHQINPHNHNELHGLLLIVYRLIVDRHGLLQVCHSPGSTLDVGLWLLEQLLIKPLVSGCDVTSTLYHEIVTKLLEHAFHQEAISVLGEKAECGLAELAWNAQTAIHTYRNRTFDDKFLVAQCQLLLLLAQYSDSQLSCEHQWPQITEVISKSLQHSCPVVSHHALEYLGCKSLEAVEGFLPEVIKIVCEVDGDQDVLAKAFFCLANVEGLLQAIADTQESGKVLDRAVDLSHQKYIRLELRVQLMHFVSAALVFNVSEVPQWLTLLKESISPTQPVELRIAVARSLLELWNVVHETVDITVYCKLVVDLLQDADVDVREEMAESVAAIIAQANVPSSLGNSVHHPTAYSALKTFLESLFFLFPECKVQCFGILLDLISVGSEHVSERPTNPLFDEDPINNYKEEARLVQVVGKCLEQFVVTHYAEVMHQLQQLCERVTLLLQLHLQELLSCCLEFWEQPNKFLFLYKLLVLRKVLLSAPLESTHTTFMKTAVDQLREATKTRIFHSLILNVL